MNRAVDVLVRSVSPLLLALIAGGLIVWALGADPLAFYVDVLRFGVAGDNWQQSLTAMAPLLLVALGLIIAFRAQLWNLGGTGAYLLAAAVVAGIAPAVLGALPFLLGTTVLLVVGFLIGAVLGLLPALLKARHGTNEIITSLMVSFIAAGLANMLVKGALQDPGVTVPQTRVLDVALMLPYLPGTRVHVGFVLALAAVVIAHVVLNRTAFGLRVDMLGASPKATAHAGVNARRLIVVVMLLSTGTIALAGAVDMLGLWGYMRTGWNPGYADKILPFVFLARLNPLGAVPFVAFTAVLATGGTLAAQRAGVSVDLLLVIVALVLLFMTLVELLGRHRGLGASYLAAGSGIGGAR